MKIMGSRGYVISITAAALLAGCGGSQPPLATAQSRGVAQRGGSWMLPEAKGGNLLYVSSLNKVTIYAYPSHKVVGKLTGFSYATGLCSDQSGNVWVTDSRESQISEYAHGGTKQIAVLSDQDEPVGCAVDPRSGDLAVANYTDNVYVYPHASGSPAIYTAPHFYEMSFCSYDDSGNLFVDGWRARGENGFEEVAMLELSYGETQLHGFKLVGRRRISLRSAGGLQWDGKSLVVGYGGKYHNELYRISDRGRVGKITKKITVTAESGFIPGDAPFVLHGSSIVGRYNVNTTEYYIAFWPYPTGGNPAKEFKVDAKFVPAGLAISVPPK